MRISTRNGVVDDHDACGVGFIAQLGSAGSHEVLQRALTALLRLSHRGGVDADGLSGDGAGLLTAIPMDFIRRQAKKAGFHLPATFGLGMIFLWPGAEDQSCTLIEKLATRSGLRCVGWRAVPTDSAMAGPRALDTLPIVRQCFFAAENTTDIERSLFILRKQAEAELGSAVYFCSLSSRTVVYKGLLTPRQLPAFYPDLLDPEFKTSFAVFHQRYSTNTRPAWSLAQPFRFVAHNGEINTIGGNRRWQRARAAGIRRQLGLGDEFPSLMEECVSDSASFDNAFETLLRQGFNPQAAMLRMAPPAWESDPHVPARLRNYLAASASVQEPWDGPAALVFSDGLLVGAKLDRNGLRPMRYTLTADGLLVAGSEVGLADFDDKQIIERQRLGPGEMLVVDTVSGVLFRNQECLDLISARDLVAADLAAPSAPARFQRSTLSRSLAPSPTEDAGLSRKRRRVAAALGWTEDQFQILFKPLVTRAEESTWSMGDDAPPAFLSSARRPLWEHCKQRFAQVTNPPIDPLREKHVMSLDLCLGQSLVISSPVLDAAQLDDLQTTWLQPAHVVDLTFAVERGIDEAYSVLDRVRQETARAIASNAAMLLLTDRDAGEFRTAVPALLAVAAAANFILENCGGGPPIVIETGQVIDTHHVALLIAAGASAVHPSIALELAGEMHPGSAHNYSTALDSGLRKTLARMGISTLASYRNSQLFEIIGLDEDLCRKFFEDAPSVLGGKSLDALLQDVLVRHCDAFASSGGNLRDAGLYRFRKSGELHSNSPALVRHLHGFVKSPAGETYGAYADVVLGREPVAVRDLLHIEASSPIAIDEVEPESEILKRFASQAMSLGAISPEVHRTLAIAMNRLGARSNTGEGGEDSDIYREHPQAANRVKQVSSGRFGVTAEYLARADELEIKMAQGSKPGEGGQLPASKVSVYIARLRHAVPGMALISPPPHHDIYSIEDLAQLIFDLRAINPGARIGVKLVSTTGVGIIAAGVAKAGATVITISGFDGGTGASPLTSIKNTGLPWEVGLREAHSALVQAGFRDSVRLRVDGGFKLGRDIIIAALLGADEFGFGTAALVAVGCVMARQCHLNTCPVGIATQDETLRARFTGNPEMLVAYFRAIANEVRERLASMGARSIAEITGDVHRLRVQNTPGAPAVATLLQSSPPKPPSRFSIGSGGSFERDLPYIPETLAALAPAPQVFAIANGNRSVGARLTGDVLRRTNFAGLGARTIYSEFCGSAGQSFGAFLIPGIQFHLNGDANDYVAKGLSGGRVVITAGAEASQRGDVLAGNTVLYGATSGELYIAGAAGERFAVRNSGALAVVEGVGQHGCEYMTAGVVLILGPAGANLGAGMTGGLAYISSAHGGDYNREFVRTANLAGEEEEDCLRSVLKLHLELSGSDCARSLLSSERPLPLLRMEPIVPPCTTARTWAPVLARLAGRDGYKSSAASQEPASQAAPVLLVPARDLTGDGFMHGTLPARKRRTPTAHP